MVSLHVSRTAAAGRRGVGGSGGERGTNRLNKRRSPPPQPPQEKGIVEGVSLHVGQLVVVEGVRAGTKVREGGTKTVTSDIRRLHRPQPSNMVDLAGRVRLHVGIVDSVATRVRSTRGLRGRGATRVVTPRFSDLRLRVVTWRTATVSLGVSTRVKRSDTGRSGAGEETQMGH